MTTARVVRFVRRVFDVRLPGDLQGSAHGTDGHRVVDDVQHAPRTRARVRHALVLLDRSVSAADGRGRTRFDAIRSERRHFFVLRLSHDVAGFLIDFISGPVNSGFTSAVAILIVASQIKDLIGITAKGTTLMDMVISISRDIEHYRPGDTVFGITCIVVILLLRVRKTPELLKMHHRNY